MRAEVVRVPKAELDALVEATSRVSRDLTRIAEAVRMGSSDGEVEITAAIVAVNELARHLRSLRSREERSPAAPHEAA